MKTEIITVKGEQVRIQTCPSTFKMFFGASSKLDVYGYLPDKYYSTPDVNERDILWVHLDTGIQVNRKSSLYTKLCLQFELSGKTTIIGTEHKKKEKA